MVIRQSATEAAGASELVSSGLVQSAENSQEISERIARVNNAAKEAAQGADHTRHASEKLSELAQTLQSLVGQFKFSQES